MSTQMYVEITITVPVGVGVSVTQDTHDPARAGEPPVPWAEPTPSDLEEMGPPPPEDLWLDPEMAETAGWDLDPEPPPLTELGIEEPPLGWDDDLAPPSLEELGLSDDEPGEEPPPTPTDVPGGASSDAPRPARGKRKGKSGPRSGARSRRRKS